MRQKFFGPVSVVTTLCVLFSMAVLLSPANATSAQAAGLTVVVVNNNPAYGNDQAWVAATGVG